MHFCVRIPHSKPDNSASMLTMLRTRRPGFDFRQRQEMFLLATRFATHPNSYPMDTGMSFPGGKTEGA